MNSGPQTGGEGADRGLSLREFARRLGISEKAVRKARDAGRLQNCLGNDGKVIDFVRASQAFAKSSRTGVGVLRTGPQAQAEGQNIGDSTPSKPNDVTAMPTVGEDSGRLVGATTLIEAQTSATNERARKLKFENDLAAGRLIPIERVTKEAFEAERIVRENVLNLPARIAGELAAETDTGRVFRLLDTALRQALNAAADALLEAVNE